MPCRRFLVGRVANAGWAMMVMAATIDAQAPRPAVKSYVSAAAADPAPYTRYAPRQCAQAIRAEWQYWRNRSPDTVYRAPLGNRRAPINIPATKACVARFDVAKVAAADLPGLATAYLAADEDEKADLALKRWLSVVVQDAPGQQGWMMVQIVKIYANASPSRLAMAKKMLAQLDALGPAWASSQLLARLVLIEQAQYLDNLPLFDTLVTSAMSLARGLTGDTAKTYVRAISKAYGARADLESRRNEPDKARATLAEGSAYAKRFVSSEASLDIPLRFMFAHQGKPAKPVAATKWINAGADTVMPVPGRPTLLVFGAPCGVACYRGYAILRRFMAKHPEIVVTLVVQSTGSYGTKIVPADTEAVLKARYFEERAGLKVPIAMWYTDYSKRADGRRSAKTSPNDVNYRAGIYALHGFLVDARGIIRRLAVFDDSTEALLDREAREVVEAGKSAPAAGAPAPGAAAGAAKVDEKLPGASWVDTATKYNVENLSRYDWAATTGLLKGIKMTTAELKAVDAATKGMFEKRMKAITTQLRKNSSDGLPVEVAQRRYVKINADLQAAETLQIRALLTTEQRVSFDANVKARDEEK